MDTLVGCLASHIDYPIGVFFWRGNKDSRDGSRDADKAEGCIKEWFHLRSGVLVSEDHV